MPSQSSSRSERDRRIAEIDEQLKPIREQLYALSAERGKLVEANDREEFPDGPFTLRYWRYHSECTQEYDRPLDALYGARAMEDSGDGSTVNVTDRHGNVIYDLRAYPPELVAAGYPEVPGDAV